MLIWKDELRKALQAELEALPGVAISHGMAMLDYPLDLDGLVDRIAGRVKTFEVVGLPVITMEELAARHAPKPRH